MRGDGSYRQKLVTGASKQLGPLHKEYEMAKNQSHHVVPDPDGGWNVRRGGADRISGHFRTKADAVDAARQISRNQRTELFIHGQDGQIQARDSHGNDPFPPKG